VYLSDKRPINLFALSPTPLPSSLQPPPPCQARIKAASSNLSVYHRYGSRDGFAPEGLLFPPPRPATGRVTRGAEHRGEGGTRDEEGNCATLVSSTLSVAVSPSPSTYLSYEFRRMPAILPGSRSPPRRAAFLPNFVFLSNFEITPIPPPRAGVMLHQHLH